MTLDELNRIREAAGLDPVPPNTDPALLATLIERHSSGETIKPAKKAKGNLRLVPPDAPPPPSNAPSSPEDFRIQLDVNGENIPKKTLGNVMLVLSQDARWHGVIARDEFLEAPVLTRQPPQREADAVPIAPGSEWTPQDSARAATWLAQNYGLDVPSKLVTEAVLAVAQRNVRHPVREYLDSLRWDGVKRVDSFFHAYAGAPDNEYTTGVSRLLLLPAVARVRKPGCKVDTMVVAEGDQGLLKSSLFRRLFGDQWFSDTQIPLNDKDKYQQLRGVWGYELAELASLKGRDANQVKAFLSSQVDRYRPSYEPRNRAVPRQCVFVGTVNPLDGYLNDPTGARRFWPIATPKIVLDAITRDRDQLWAEADFRVRNGEQWWPTKRVEELGAHEQEERFESDPWEGPLEAWLSRPVRVRHDMAGKRFEEPLDPTLGFSMSDILLHGLGLRVERHGKPEQHRAATILKRAGWKRGSQAREKGKQGKPVRRWFRAGDTPGDGAGDTGKQA